ncbi:hypothetical protein EUGRSUZ_A00742 [Eucalyptus grandis]|uniref:Uncharacterized protein n=2 Tax=Eucalyptus grandis TaxID=71139 RepID=A0ACC3M0Q2_EUCGR|nr:hypothetical protein EUGRSUZ_A00742 [Eucalyptus grandis]
MTVLSILAKIEAKEIIKLLLKLKPDALAHGSSQRRISKSEIKTIIATTLALLQWASPWTSFCKQENGQQRAELILLLYMQNFQFILLLDRFFLLSSIDHIGHDIHT